MTDWREHAKSKRDSVNDLIPKEWRLERIPSPEEQCDVTDKYIHQFLSPREIEITETDAVGIASKTTVGEWKALEVAKAFCHRAALAHQLVSCLHEIFFEAAYRDAQKLDDYFSEHKKPIGPLHGLPVSLKDQFHVRGVETHMGYVGWLGSFEGKKDDPRAKTRDFESELVKELRDLGAVLYVKTSVPHTLMCGETFNNIVGYTLNPKNRNLSSGGSSGGEGALIGLKGSPIGFGTDIGGSIRIPAAFNGLFGIRPSSGRFPYEGMANSMDGQNTILSVVGPLATTPGSLRLMTKCILSQQPWLHDPLVHDMPWREDKEQEILDIATGKTGKLSVGILRSDGVVHPTPPVRRAVELVGDTLKKLGHETLDWQPSPSQAELVDVGDKVWGFDAGADLRSAFNLSGEEPYSEIIMPLDSSEKRDATGIAAVNVEKRQKQKAYMEYWNSTINQTSTGRPVDFFIAPLAPFPAARPKKYKYVGYSSFVNVLDYTSVVVPVTLVDKSIDKKDEGYEPKGEIDKIIYESYDPEIYDGAHVSIQLVGRRLQEEKMIALATYVAEALRTA